MTESKREKMDEAVSRRVAKPEIERVYRDWRSMVYQRRETIEELFRSLVVKSWKMRVRHSSGRRRVWSWKESWGRRKEKVLRREEDMKEGMRGKELNGGGVVSLFFFSFLSSCCCFGCCHFWYLCCESACRFEVVFGWNVKGMEGWEKKNGVVIFGGKGWSVGWFVYLFIIGFRFYYCVVTCK